VAYCDDRSFATRENKNNTWPIDHDFDTLAKIVVTGTHILLTEVKELLDAKQTKCLYCSC
jgi:hypothetical protein